MPSPAILSCSRAGPLPLQPIDLPPVGDSGSAPDWLLLASPGESCGYDGRCVLLDAPAAVLAAYASRGIDIPIDWEHSTHLRAPQGDTAPAAGWVVELQARDGAIWGRVEWTAAGAADVATRAYRYYSPAYLIDPDTGAVRSIQSVGLTNQPNLSLPALNRATDPDPETAMPLPPALASALGLEAEASEDDALSAVRAIQDARDTALHRAATPDLALYVPRAEFDAALHRATTAEADLAAAKSAETERAIEALIARGLEEARITPATADYHRAQARTDGGLARLESYLATAPVVVSSHRQATRPPAEVFDSVLQAEFGDEAAYQAYRRAAAAGRVKLNQENRT